MHTHDWLITNLLARSFIHSFIVYVTMCRGMSEPSNAVTCLAKEFYDQHTKQQQQQQQEQQHSTTANSNRLSPRGDTTIKHIPTTGISEDMSIVDLFIASYNTSLSPAMQMRLITAVKDDPSILRNVDFSSENVCYIMNQPFLS